MDPENPRSPEIKSVGPENSEQVPVTTKTAVPKKAPTKVPEGYKLVKVRKPDGTVKTVLRPIAKDAVTGAPSTSAAPSKDIEKPAKQIDEAVSTSKTTPKIVEQPTKAEAVVADKQALKSSAEKPSGATPSKPTNKKTEPTPEKIATPPAHTSKLDAVSKSSRIFRRFHRFSRHTSRIAGAFDPDIVDYEDGDISISDYSQNDSDSDSDDPDRAHNRQQDYKPGSGTKPQGTAANVGRNPTSTRTTPVANSKKLEVSVQEKADSKSSAELSKDTSVLEEEMLPVKGQQDGKDLLDGPRSLRNRSTDWGKLVVWSLVILFPLAFIGLGIATACLDGEPTTQLVDYDIIDFYFSTAEYRPTLMSQTITYATKVAITAWPIVFAAILAQTLKALATYQVERGIRLMTLEQLISSHSVASALKQPFILRRVNWITVGLISLWALSPLGSQAMQYTTNKVDNYIPSGGPIYYLNTVQENPALSSDWQAANNYSDSMDILYAAVFQQESQFQPKGSDPWGNPKIPVYEYLQEKPVPDSDKRLDVDLRNASYSSYYGIPLANFTEDEGVYGGTWNFTMESSYLLLECPPLRFETFDTITEELNRVGINIFELWNTTGASLIMDMDPPYPDRPYGNLTFISSCSAKKTASGTATYAISTCSLSQTFVTSDIYCVNTNCTVLSIQKHPNHAPTNLQNFMPEFIKASDTGLSAFPILGNTTYSITELFIRNRYNATQPGAGETCDLSDSSITDDPETFTKSLSYLINTFYSTGFTHDFQVGSIKPNQTVTLWNETETGGFEYTVPLTAFSPGIHNSQSDFSPFLWRIDWTFIALYEICAVTLLLIGIAGVLLESRTIAPDILGFASSVARHSRYVKLPKVDGTMSGAERARRMGDTRVMMQDVRGESEVGRIVLGSVSEGAVRLRQGRLYK